MADDRQTPNEATNVTTDAANKQLNLERLQFDASRPEASIQALEEDLQATAAADQVTLDRIANEALVRHEINSVDFPDIHDRIQVPKGAAEWNHDKSVAILEEGIANTQANDAAKANRLKGSLADVKDLQVGELLYGDAARRELAEREANVTRTADQSTRAQGAEEEFDAQVVTTQTGAESEAGIENRGSVTEDRIKALPEEVEQRFRIEQRGSTQRYYLQGQEREAITERENKIVVTPQQSKLVASDAAKIADAKGWTNIRVTGNDEFRREVWKEANVRGIEVIGYEPTEQDKRDLDRRLNSIEAAPRENQGERENERIAPKVQVGTIGDSRSANPEANEPSEKRAQLEDAYANKSREDAVREHPELNDLYKLESAATQFAESRIEGEKSQQAFVDNVRDRGLDELSRGNKLPELKPAPIQPQQEKGPLSVGR